MDITISSNMTRYYKNGTITTRPVIPNVVNPSHETILANGWYVYIDNPPAYDDSIERIERAGVIEGVVQYEVIALTPEEIRERTVPATITNGQGKLQLLALGIYAQVEAMIEQSGDAEKIYWNDWDTWRRDSAIINRLAPIIWEENTDELLDQFFIEAAKIQ
jgi:hypothetical protein